VFSLIADFYQTKGYPIGNQWPKEFVVITSNINNTSTTLGMSQYSSNDIGVRLFPSQFVLLNLPPIDDIANEIKSFAAMVLEKIIKSLSLAVFGSKVNI
jgi:hypothetical protein